MNTIITLLKSENIEDHILGIHLLFSKFGDGWKLELTKLMSDNSSLREYILDDEGKLYIFGTYSGTQRVTYTYYYIEKLYEEWKKQ